MTANHEYAPTGVQDWWLEYSPAATVCNACGTALGEGTTLARSASGDTRCPRCLRERDADDGILRDFVAEVGYAHDLDAWILFLPEGGYMALPSEESARGRQWTINREQVEWVSDACAETVGDRAFGAAERLYTLRLRAQLAHETCTLRRRPAAGEGKPWRPDND